MDRILILGASGFIGSTMYKELCPYFDTYGTYHTGKVYSSNKHYFNFTMEQDDVYTLLLKLKPTIVITALRGDFTLQIETHKRIVDYITNHKCKLIFFSSANVFDAFSNYPSYEFDKTLSESIYGKLKIRIENMLLRLPQHKYVIARLPMVFGNNAPRVKEIKRAIQDRIPVEVFPNLVMNVAADVLLSQQIHYIINRKKSGIFHLGCQNLIHHDEFIELVVEKLEKKVPIYKNVYTSNFDRYLAVIPKDNLLPKHLQYRYEDVLDIVKKSKT